MALTQVAATSGMFDTDQQVFVMTAQERA